MQPSGVSFDLRFQQLSLSPAGSCHWYRERGERREPTTTMPGRGRGIQNCSSDTLRRPGQTATETSSVEDLIEKICHVKSPDDLQIQTLASNARSVIITEDDLRNFVAKLCHEGLSDRAKAPVVAAFCGETGHLRVGETKLRNLLMGRVQAEYVGKDELLRSDPVRFVTSAMFLGEVYNYVTCENGSPFKVLSEPVMTYLMMVVQLHTGEETKPTLDDDMGVVAKQLLQRGHMMYACKPALMMDLISAVTEIMCRHNLSQASTLNLLAALAELWPQVSGSYNSRTTHATLAAKLGVSLQI
ncbi:CBP80/20-dependent translation initiation factor-like isoform X2 [Oratosquilla oratoria]|uniref:CBP80/20-dependent translation initiation factor-like isoform X2 n=1 Tax=Oratosquilla oratoria TaxID=337810 RepID=UPI003F76F39B